MVEPKRKALRISLTQSFTIAALQDLGNRMLQDASLITAQEFGITSTFKQMPEPFFETDPPLIGDIPHEKMRWLTSVQDQSGEMCVIVWDKACFELFHMTASQLRDLWEDGHQNPSKRADLLELLNDSIEGSYRCVGSAQIWSYGGQNTRSVLQININAVEAEDS